MVTTFVEVNPQIRAGEPVVRGTRISVYVLADLFEQGASPSEILQDFPSLTEESLEAAVAYARTRPRPAPQPASWRNGVIILRAS
jgi:uncharacterized protein (DUF433 family)